MSTGRVVVYEPNPLNPYGAEVARILVTATAGQVQLIVRRGAPPRIQDGVTVHPILEGGSDGAPLRSRALTRVLGPLRAAARAGREPLVVIWTRDLWDAAVFAARASIGLPVLVVDHNPVPGRRRGGAAGHGERVLRKRATVVVSHSEQLADLTRRGTRRPVVVAPHPAYTGMAGTTSAHAPRPSSRAQVAVIGGFRRDKGVEHLPTIAEQSGGGWDLLVLGPDRLSPQVTERLLQTDVRALYPRDLPLSDDDLVQGLQQAAVVLAPYSDVTESGSVILAITVGRPVLGLDSPGLRRLLEGRSRTQTPEALGRLVRDFLHTSWTTACVDGPALDRASIAGWREALRVVERRSRRR